MPAWTISRPQHGMEIRICSHALPDIKVLLKGGPARSPQVCPDETEYIVSANAGDAIRPFLLDAYGGLYMDVDVECFDATNDMVDGFDLVLQLEDNGNKSLNNAVMAGAPGLDLWDNMQHLLKDR